MFKLLAAIPAADVMADVNFTILFMNFTPLNLDQIVKKFQILKSENDLQLSYCAVSNFYNHILCQSQFMSILRF